MGKGSSPQRWVDGVQLLAGDTSVLLCVGRLIGSGMIGGSYWMRVTQNRKFWHTVPEQKSFRNPSDSKTTF